jgi:SAM-dependent methyltransferase
MRFPCPWRATSLLDYQPGSKVDELIFQGIPSDPFVYICPVCHTRLTPSDQNTLCCPVDQLSFPKVDGIRRFLLPERLTFYERFMQDYEAIRQKEGRGATNSAYYQTLPFRDLSGKFSAAWRIRARSYQVFRDLILHPFESSSIRPLKIIDLGAGNGWLSNRLAQQGHQVAAVDIITNSYDGLGTWIYYETTYEPIQAEFDRLPFADAQCDLIIFNASFHYSTNFETTLCESLRVLKPKGQLVILDTPIYHNPSSGLQMVQERESYFQRQYGFPSNSLPSENYLTDDRLESLGNQLGVQWKTFQPNYGLRWKLRPWLARVRRQREPARFMVVAARPL